MAQKLAYELGLGVGISSGGNFIGALKVQNMLGSNAVVTTVFPDDSKKISQHRFAKYRAYKVRLSINRC